MIKISVSLDPTIQTADSTQVEDNHVADGSLKDTQYPYYLPYMYAGKKDGIDYVAYCRPAIPEGVKAIADHIIIQEASVRIYVQEKKGSGPYTMHLVNGPWSSRTITGDNKPTISEKIYGTFKMNEGIRNLDIKELVSEWFNNLDQRENCGFALKGNGKNNDYILMSSSDDPAESQRLIFTITYEEINTKAKLGLKAKSHGNGANSGTGYVNLSWKKVENAEKYYVAVFNGKTYEYFLSDDSTSWSTKDQGIWPTQEEIAKGRYRLHHDGKGEELPCIPAFTYANVPNGEYKTSLEYYFKVVPCNEYGQAIAPDTFASVSAVLPDTIAPNQPAAVSVNPSGYSNDKNFTVSWSGVKDFTTASEKIQTNVGSGKIQYSIDGTDHWKDTDSNSASGKYTFDASGCEDGIHTVYIRGKDGSGNTGAPRGASFKVDRSGPAGQTVTVLPSGWTKDGMLAVNVSGMKDLNPIARIEYRMDSGSWTDTGKTSGSFAGYQVDISRLSDGRHTLSLRGTDSIGNVGTAVSTAIYIDRSAPAIKEIRLEPSGWNREKEITLFWEGVKDDTSGVAKLEYAVDGEWKEIQEIAEDGSIAFLAEELSDGEHEVALRATDQAGCVSKEAIVTLYRDTRAPEVSITEPSDLAIQDGQIQVKGEMREAHLKKWQLLATGSGDNVQILAEGGEAETEEEEPQVYTMSASLDLSDYPDGENVSLILYAEDEAGNIGEMQITVIRVGGSMQPFEATLGLELPDVLREAQSAGTYTLSGAEVSTVLYVDGKKEERISGGSFLVDGVRYPEGSRHTLTAIAKREDGTLAYSQGLGTQTLMEELWEKGASAQDGTYVSPILRAVKPMLALRLDVTDFTPGESSISYEYSTDGGISWQSIQPGEDALLSQPSDAVQIRASLVSDGERQPAVYRMEAAGVLEFSPKQFTVRIERKAQTFGISGPGSAVKARTALETNLVRELLEQARQVIWFVGGEGSAPPEGEAPDTLDALRIPEGGGARISGALLSGDGTLYLSGADSERLLREDTGYTSDTVQRGIACGAQTAALLLQAAVRGEGARFSYSENGENWIQIEPGRPVLLGRMPKNVYLRAEMEDGARLAGWELLGYHAQGYTVKSVLVQTPAQVTAADYGESDAPRYEISWQDVQEADDTAAYQTTYRIYRNGGQIGESRETSFTDSDYHADASYQVSACRTYAAGDYPVRESQKAPAAIVKITGDKVEETGKKLEVFAQSDYLSSLYGGDHTFSLKTDPPKANLKINQKLLGKSQYCALGFEPVNFNTGNFLVEAGDYSYPLREGTSFDIIRTYNAQSTQTDGPFGAGWSFAWGQYLQQYADGTIGWRMADGALALFTDTQDGYVCDLDAHLSLEKDADGYQAADSEGGVWRFTKEGLLSEAEIGGYVIRMERKEADLFSGKTDIENQTGVLKQILLPSGETVRFESDALGHITKVTEADGTTLSYAYEGNYLVSAADETGYAIRYVYDEQGRMIEWYDKAGTCQACNEYDDRNRVIRQKDAQGAQYTLEYFEDHTIVTDGEGNVSEIWFDERMRTTKVVDAQGGETLYAYDGEGNLSGVTDSLGRFTAYEYDARGSKTRAVAADGSECTFEYDAQGHLVAQTDQRGNRTAYEYDERGNLTRTIFADGSSQSSEYDSQDRRTSFTDPLGGVTYYEYGTSGKSPVRITDANGNTTFYEYDAQGHMTASENALGERTEYEYDTSGNLLKTIFADGAEYAYTYDVLGNLLTHTDALGNVTCYEYDSVGNNTAIIYADGSRMEMAYTSNGNLSSETDTMGGKTTYTYDGNGNKITQEDALGNQTSYEYDSQGRLVKEISPSGAARTYEYDPVTGLVIAETDGSGVRDEFEYDPSGNLTAWIYANGARLENTYDSMDRLVSRRNPNGGVTRYEYNALGMLTTKTDALGNRTRYEYDALGNLLCVTDPLGGVTCYEYDALSRKIAVTDANGARTSYTYDAAGNVISVTDALGNVTEYGYDLNGAVIASKDALGYTSGVEYDSRGLAVTVTQKNGGEVIYEYDALGRVTKQTDALGGEISYTYDALSNVIAVTDALGQEAQFSYDALGNVTKITWPDGTQASYRYDGAGRLLSVADENGVETEYAYDEMGHMISTASDGAATDYAYDMAGNLIQMTDEQGSATSFGYDVLGHMTDITYADGTRDTYTYDALGRLSRKVSRDGAEVEYGYDAIGNVARIESGGEQTTYEYDALSRLVKKTFQGASTRYEYDAFGNMISETDALGNTVHYEYDASGQITAMEYADGVRISADHDLNGNVVSETDALGNETRYQYDAVGRLSAVTDALGGTTRYEYDRRDNVSKVIDALGHETAYEYDASGNLLRETDALGNTTAYTYTSGNRLDTVTKPDGTAVRYTYDKNGQVTREEYSDGRVATFEHDEAGRVTAAEDADGRIQYQYDDNGYLILVSYPSGDVVQYGYDGAGNRTSLTYPDGRKAAYDYDAQGRMTRVTGPDGEETHYSYDALGRRTETSGSTLKTTYEYDAAGNIVRQSVTGDTSIDLEYSYDLRGNLIREKRSEQGSTVTSNYSYDALGRISSFATSDGYSENYSYDAAGNMTLKQAGDIQIHMSYNAADQMVGMESAYGRIDYTYNANGDLTDKVWNGQQRDTYEYDAAGNLVKYTGYDGYTVDYAYSPMGMLTEKTTAGESSRATLEGIISGKAEPEAELSVKEENGGTVTTQYTYDILSAYYSVLTSTENGNSTAYEYGLERLASYQSSDGEDKKTQYVYDVRGSVIQAVSDGTAQDYRYTPFGEQYAQPQTSGYTYNAEYYDASTSFHQYGGSEGKIGIISKEIIPRHSEAECASLRS